MNTVQGRERMLGRTSCRFSGEDEMTDQLAAEAQLDAEAVAGLTERVRGPVLAPADPGYDEARSIWNALIDRRPALIVQCSGAADVVDAVNFAREQGLVLSIKAGGHNVAGNAVNDGGIVLDLSQMRGVIVDPSSRTVRVQGGATWGDCDRETQLFGLAVPGGVVSTTGVAGLTLHGGVGHLRRKYGLSIDSLLSVDIITADGRFQRASATENEDLFWAVRGAGSNFGVVTSFEFAAHPVGPAVFVGAIFYPFEDAPAILPAWRDFMAAAPEELSSLALCWSVPPHEPFPPELHGTPVVVVAAAYWSTRANGSCSRCASSPSRSSTRAGRGRGSVCRAASTRSSRRASSATGSRVRSPSSPRM